MNDTVPPTGAGDAVPPAAAGDAVPPTGAGGGDASTPAGAGQHGGTPPAGTGGGAPAGLLAGRRVVVVGGASGIGRAAVAAAAAAGAAVAVLDADTAGADSAAAQARAAGAWAWARGVDVTVEAEVAGALDAAAADLGGIDAVLHVAGVMRGQGLDVRDVPVALWAQVIAVNLTGPFLVAKHAARHLRPDGGVLVLVGSKAGVQTGSGSVPYGASKGGLHGLALTLARQLGPQGIRVHALCPGDIDTPLMRRSLDEARANGTGGDRIAAVEATLGRPEDVASVLVLLASPASAGLAGTVWTG
ncbi:NAD(P)-dependent dehydrogenase, short-chain alcohol dehydrogenase family [Micromonospora matsumotoense]|uniref:NAD(P)-dependent dehydrogenase, short-chain alcohol dehydrogenase family n=1 Tax=Micromonospora matsumotoense TaxID=121616 RepID=A0A1C5APL0_9ACTN|nr:SDR family oxidoreductase [Micromonospora matsumotoense]SCF47130.1 NAD(P)-dependent dehydrogenase, short-chain alcohol dehydrogenase family [Micromonospora matsumotoense]